MSDQPVPLLDSDPCRYRGDPVPPVLQCPGCSARGGQQEPAGNRGGRLQEFWQEAQPEALPADTGHTQQPSIGDWAQLGALRPVPAEKVKPRTACTYTRAKMKNLF